ncbi:unnamed protein product [Caenorhabditis brenneri]
MSSLCSGELNGVCVVALALRGRVTSMDAYLFGQMDPEKAVCCIYHNYAHHDTIITEQMENLRRIVEVRVQREFITEFEIWKCFLSQIITRKY